MTARAGVSVTEEVKVFGKQTGRGWAGERGNPILDVRCLTCSKYIARVI